MSSASRRILRYTRDGVIFVPRFLPEADLAAVQADCRSLRGGMKAEKGSIAVKRLRRCVDRRSETHRRLTSPATIQRVAALLGCPMTPSQHPIELRSYRAGSGMNWHRDDQLYADPQCELVLCLDNTSDSRTEWIDASGEHRAEWTPPGSALLIRAGSSGAAHRVIPLKRGERTILKMVWTVPGSAMLDTFYDQVGALPGVRSRLLKQVEAGRKGRGGKRRRRR